MDQLFQRVEIEINRKCNLRCSYCPNSLYKTPQNDEMSLETFELLMSQLKEIDYCGDITYEFYNEPMLCSNVHHFVKRTRESLPKATILFYSNGTLIDRGAFDQLIDEGVDKFIITKHEGVSNYIFDEVYEGLSEKLRNRVEFQSFQDLRLTNRGGLVEGAGASEIPALLPCYLPSFITVVTLEGDVVGCFEDFHKKNVMGNINDEGLDEIWNNEKYREFRYALRKCLRHKHDPCRSCNRLNILPEGYITSLPTS